MQRERDTKSGSRKGAERRARLWDLAIPTLFGLGVALALLTPVLGVGSYLASLLVAGAAVVVTAAAPVRQADGKKSSTRQRETARFASARGRGEHWLPLSGKRRQALRDRRTPRAGV